MEQNIMRLPNVCNLDVQRFMDERRYNYREACSTKMKESIIEKIENTCRKISISFQKLFKPKTKIKSVLDEIVFLLSGTGICKVSSKTLAQKIDCTERTIWETVKRIKETGEILVTGLADGSNKYVFVLKSHSNFKSILKEVFFVDGFISEPISEPSSDHSSEPQNAEILDAQGIEVRKSSSNNNNFFTPFKNNKTYKESIYLEQIEKLELGSSSKKVLAHLTDRLILFKIDLLEVELLFKNSNLADDQFSSVLSDVLESDIKFSFKRMMEKSIRTFIENYNKKVAVVTTATTKKPTRTEVLPDWFDDESEDRQQQPEPNTGVVARDNVTQEEKKQDIERMLKQLRVG